MLSISQIKNKSLYGLEEQHLVAFEGQLLEQKTAIALAKMQQAAFDDGVTISLCSGYRSFEKQMQIWNNKASGKRQLLDQHNQPVAWQDLTANKLIDTILIWSALPGASRHHWGTDVDLFDVSAISKQDLQLISAEYQPGGPCNALYQWLEKNSHRFGFYRPFQQGLSGVSPEPWHYSFYPVSQPLTQLYQAEDLAVILNANNVQLKQQLVARLPELVKEYVFTVAPAPKAFVQEQVI
ncbi:M15 family metallopeptidase [Shewanella waksmanii]|uniref:M15 family metallopeptidase n=1 Tax=Shewanella waksmanii TaxID=213783 RepID=UPI00048F53C2|nr:M15 family metallopeptidase [Shewanella waksmanii]